ncbi:hypothetical protein AB0F57_05770 [Streptomyces tanashiensis]|uniref:hypothetical protein n=1 Tax=Streptomyces tanashiensis TaxID=67367 RepID=UPI003408E2AC
MSGDNYYGDVVNMHGGQGNQGIVHHHGSPDLERALAAVLQRVEELRASLPAGAVESVDGATADLAVPDRRRGALQVLQAVAATAGGIGQPLLDSVRAALELLAR